MTNDCRDNHFFISSGTGEIVSKGYLQGNGDYFPRTPNNTYCIGISKNLKFTYKQLDQIIDSAITLYNEEHQIQEVFDEATELLVKKRKQNTPYKNEHSRGKGDYPRQICSKCGRFMLKTQAKYSEDGIRKTITPNAQCKCGNVEVYEDELKKIPE